MNPESFDARYLSFTPPHPPEEPPERHISLLPKTPRGQPAPMPDKTHKGQARLMSHFPNMSHTPYPICHTPFVLSDRILHNQGWTVASALKWSPRLALHVKMVDRYIAALKNAMAIAKASPPPFTSPNSPLTPTLTPTLTPCCGQLHDTAF